MTLHEAIENVLNKEKAPLSLSEIARRINSNKLYQRGDNNPVPSGQVSARVNNYPRIFNKANGLISLNNWDRTIKAEKTTKSESQTPEKKTQIIIKGNPLNLEFLKQNGFANIGTIGQLSQQGLPALNELNKCGLYAITLSKDYKPDFIDSETALFNVIRPWSREQLRAKWVEGTVVIYYGLAGNQKPRSLRKRLNDLLRHANGKLSSNGPHKGGEIVWQLKGYHDFELWIKSTTNPPTPRTLEHEILSLFVNLSGKLPFGNRKL